MGEEPRKGDKLLVGEALVLLQGAIGRKLAGQQSLLEVREQFVRTFFAVEANGFAHRCRQSRIDEDFRFDPIGHTIGPGIVLVLERDLHLFMHDHLVNLVEAMFGGDGHGRESIFPFR
ncbi:hypothetical protein RHIZ404_210233 [Rhizobium sp. EC-SD404]|nr:hypothetical protein RHIZ404_210233 [Rhizobium sp. EC-SD404]